MSIESRSAKYCNALGQWQAAGILGTGSGGKSAVFSICRDNGGWQEYSAMKVITLLEERGSYGALPAFRQAEYTAAEQQVCQQATREVQLMEQLRGKTNIVDYLEHRFMRWQDANGFGIDLVIQMEQLTDLRSQLRQGRQFSPEEIRRIARDLCQALILCHGKHILHRDIKPENIFFNTDNDYKLGDFGIARIMNDTPSRRASTGVGTAAYAPPEQSSGSYDHRVDIYSLGLVLYELANGGRLPFAASSYITERDIQTRLSGAPFPPPCGTAEADPELTAIIMKACAFRPEDRFGSAGEMLQALNGRLPAPIPADSFQTLPLREDPYATSPVPETPPVIPMEEPILTGDLIIPEGQRRRFPIVLLLPLAALAAVLALFLLPHRHNWTAATCLEAEYCEDCGETRGQAPGHNWQAPTCTDPMLCARCGARSGSPLGHDWLEASCVEEKTCSRCGVTEGPVGEHSWLAAACDTPETCAACGITRGTPLGHDWLEATATEPQRCSRCGETQGRALGLPLTRCTMLETTNGGTRMEDILIGTWTDAFGSTYQEALRFWVAQLGSYADTEYIVYDLGGAYSELELTVAPLKGSADNTSTRILIYADDVLIYDSGWISTATGPLSGTLDISGVRRLKVQCTTDSPAHCYCVVDASLFP